MDKISKKIKMTKEIREIIRKNELDGIIIPKNDTYFTEYSRSNILKNTTNFSGSAGFAIILKKKKLLFVDGRYTIQAKKEVGNKFKILQIPFIFPKNYFSNINKNLKIGYDPKYFTSDTLYKYFKYSCKLIPITNIFNLDKKVKTISKPFFFIGEKITGESHISKIRKVISYMKKNYIDSFYISAGENVCWLLNIRGHDLENSPLANCKIILSKNGKINFFSNRNKIKKIKNKFKNITFNEEEDFYKILMSSKSKFFGIDKNTCSVYEENLINSQATIKVYQDPIYYYKAIKTKIEIKNMKDAHIEDGVALTKFLYWIKSQKEKVSELFIEQKLSNFRKKSLKYLYPSFNTIAGSGPNGAIIHYRATKKSNRYVNKRDILLIDSGGQYKWGTTDVTRTICFNKQSRNVKKNYTRVLKGHIAVLLANLEKYKTGHLIDKIARKSLNKAGLNYSHGTGHGVGYFLNVHEGPQSLSNNNQINLKEGMILSNEPGYYLENNYGIRIENLIFINKSKKKLYFENLTLVPLDLDLVDFNLLDKREKEYIFYYHLNIYKKLSSRLNKKERRWLIKLIQ